MNSETDQWRAFFANLSAQGTPELQGTTQARLNTRSTPALQAQQHIQILAMSALPRSTTGQTEQRNKTLADLPLEMLMAVADHLTLGEALNLAKTSRAMKHKLIDILYERDIQTKEYRSVAHARRNRDLSYYGGLNIPVHFRDRMPIHDPIPVTADRDGQSRERAERTLLRASSLGVPLLRRGTLMYESDYAIIEAAWDRDVQILEWWLDHGAQVNQDSYFNPGQTPLSIVLRHAIQKNGYYCPLGMVKALLDKGAYLAQLTPSGPAMPTALQGSILPGPAFIPGLGATGGLNLAPAPQTAPQPPMTYETPFELAGRLVDSKVPCQVHQGTDINCHKELMKLFIEFSVQSTIDSLNQLTKRVIAQLQ